jgi:hypothetical protein
MNTPKPCDTCQYLYVNVLEEDNPNYMAECEKNLKLGNTQCKEFKHYDNKLINRSVLERSKRTDSKSVS